MKSPWLWFGCFVFAIFVFGEQTSTTNANPKRSSFSHSAGNSSLNQSYKGYWCTDDCSGHEAGYEWALKKDIRDPDECSGMSQSFVEGCQAFAEEQENEKDEETDDDN
jgi:hypothetical protein